MLGQDFQWESTDLHEVQESSLSQGSQEVPFSWWGQVSGRIQAVTVVNSNVRKE